MLYPATYSAQQRLVHRSADSSADSAPSLIVPAPALDAASAQKNTVRRLRLVSCRVEHFRGALTRATVVCSRGTHTPPVIGSQDGPTCPGGDLRLAAMATLQAVQSGTTGGPDGDVARELIGVKQLRAFDVSLVIVAVLAHSGGDARRLVGTAVIDDDVAVATAKATLQALNRSMQRAPTRRDTSVPLITAHPAAHP
jgi:hypothetical protein